MSKAKHSVRYRRRELMLCWGMVALIVLVGGLLQPLVGGGVMSGLIVAALAGLPVKLYTPVQIAPRHRA
ncbi:hypothetical protein HLB23_14555 [Nocardia uniformis]|uniref:Uncharacterized protein n=1 Tax=Nocardia uniformis TaxID=53432 RepID=A0A849CDB8_9NOCA|nr:hypothetical protein [Nocardia uniformis]NNH71071.1 hypothetical protein [Nocardia uniformis]